MSSLIIVTVTLLTSLTVAVTVMTCCGPLAELSTVTSLSSAGTVVGWSPKIDHKSLLSLSVTLIPSVVSSTTRKSPVSQTFGVATMHKMVNSTSLAVDGSGSKGTYWFLV